MGFNPLKCKIFPALLGDNPTQSTHVNVVVFTSRGSALKELAC